MRIDTDTHVNTTEHTHLDAHKHNTKSHTYIDADTHTCIHHSTRTPTFT